MLHNKGPIHKIWVEVVATVTYLKNRNLNSYLEGVTLLEAWNGKKPNVSHLKVLATLFLSINQKS